MGPGIIGSIQKEEKLVQAWSLSENPDFGPKSKSGRGLYLKMAFEVALKQNEEKRKKKQVFTWEMSSLNLISDAFTLMQSKILP